MAGVSMEVGDDGAAVISICNPPANVLTISNLEKLTEKLDEAVRRTDVKAIVLTGYGGRFCCGLDLSLFQKIHQTGDISILPDVSVDLITNRIEACTKPVVAALSGLALGGGLELSMGCHARIATPGTQLSLPELLYGLTTAGGGTQRLPRLIGLPKAIDMLLSSKPIFSEEGKEVGLIDAVVSYEELVKASRIWALDIRTGRKPWIRSLQKIDKIGSISEARSILRAARQQAKMRGPNMPQYQACLDLIEEGILHGGYNGLLKEEKVFKKLAMADTSKALVHLYFAQRLTSKVISGSKEKKDDGRPILVAANRSFFPYAQSAHLLVNLGVDLFRIDTAIVKFGLPLGPFQVEDLSGYGVALAAGEEFAKVFEGRMFRSPLVELMVKDGRNGKINGKGYYIYENGGNSKPDPCVLRIIEESRRLTSIMPHGKPIEVSEEEIVEMILFPVVNEACRVLDEGLGIRASDLDVASVLQKSFPSYRGGIVFWADTVGAAHVLGSLKKWSDLYGSFFVPSRLLERSVTKGVPLATLTSLTTKL